MQKIRLFLLALMMPLFAISQNNISDIVANSPDHNTLETAITAANLTGTLSGPGPFTLFAPTDDAFAALPDGVLDALLADPSGALTQTLLDHVSAGTFRAGDLMDGMTLATAGGGVLTVTIDNGNVFINNAQVTVTDLFADNGIVHVVDMVVMQEPTTVVDVIVESDDHTTLEAAVLAAGLEGTLSGDGPFTVFAPTDDAFAALPDGTIDALLADPQGALTDILTYHVTGGEFGVGDLADGQKITTVNGRTALISINSDGIFINNAEITVTDILTDNGIVHVIDAVLIPGTTIYDVVTENTAFTTLKAAVDAAGLSATLCGPGPFTVFAPTDDAFAALPDGTIDALLADPQGALTDILLYHTLAADVRSTDLMDGMTATTINGKDVTVTINMDGVFINDAQVTMADVETDNGVIHVIDAVLIPPTTTVVDVVVESPDHTILETAVLAAGLETALSSEGPFTLFAPTDAAFAALPQEVIDALLADPTGALTNVLLYHALDSELTSDLISDGLFVETINGAVVEFSISNDSVFVNDAYVSVADIATDNGVVHVIDAVLVPPTRTVVDVIVESDVHNTLEAAVVAADLVGALSAEGPFTVFAPTDDAFAALPQELLDGLLADPTGLLANILLYHVVPGDIRSTDLVDGQMATTLLGEDVEVSITPDGVFINDAQVIMADIVTDNGVVHVIDAVLTPNPTTVVDVIVESPVHNTLEAAVIAADLVETLNGAGPFTVFAPTDDAFNALPDGTLDALLADPQGLLTDILLYHVAAGDVRSSDLVDGQMITTINGQDVTVTIDNGNVIINDALVVFPDIVASNGVVHVIDAILVPAEETTVVDVIVESPDHTILEVAVTAAGLAETLAGDGPFTVFAPTDAAFGAIPQEVIDELLADPTGDLADILLYHVLGAEVLSTDLVDGQMATTLNGKDITVTINMDGVFINDAQVTVADIVTDNGVVHVIDAVLIPPTRTVVDVIVESPDHTILETAVIAAGLAGTLSGDGPFTVFAPTDAAFAALPQEVIDAALADPSGLLTEVLLYHVVSGDIRSTDLVDGQMAMTLNGKDITVTINMDGVFINDAQVTVADIVTDNGVVHVIDAVLLPPTTTVVDVIVDSPDHTILEAAVIAANLAETLSGDGPFTVFAPTDAAFNTLPAGTIDALLADPAGDLTQILLYHVLGAQVLSTDLTDGQTATTLNGQDVTVSINTSVMINDATVVVADIVTDNGVVHVIDGVLLPELSSTEDLSDFANIKIYPNPVDNVLQVEIENLEGNFRVFNVYNNQGQLMKSAFENNINVQDLDSGLYLLETRVDDKRYFKKFIIK